MTAKEELKFPLPTESKKPKKIRDKVIWTLLFDLKAEYDHSRSTPKIAAFKFETKWGGYVFVGQVGGIWTGDFYIPGKTKIFKNHFLETFDIEKTIEKKFGKDKRYYMRSVS